MKTMLTLTALYILLSYSRWVLLPVQRGTSSKKVKMSVKKQNNIWLLFKLLSKRFSMGFILFLFLLFFVLVSPFTRKYVEEGSIFEIPVIPQTLKVNN